MKTDTTTERSTPATTNPTAPRQWAMMGVLGIAELMVTLDNSIMNIALPSAQADLGFDAAQRPWIVTAYALAFGGLLLPGGRVCDLVGRRRALFIGLLGFAISSVLGGLATGFTMLVSARVLQGVFAALLAPAALGLLTTTFPEGRQRARAFGVFATLAVSGASLGMLFGGVLTEYLDWRWCMLVNAVFAVMALTGGVLALPDSPPVRRPRLDVAGAVAATTGLFCLVYGLAAVDPRGWTSPPVLALLAASIALLTTFVLIERRAPSPLLPLQVVLDRRRGGAFLALFVAVIGLFAVILFLTYLLQRRLGLPPLLTGVSFLPMTAGIAVAANAAPGWLLPRTGPGPPVTVGLLLCAGSLLWLSALTTDSSYGTDVLGPLILLGIGLGTTISTSINTATAGVDPVDAGSASALVNVMQQIGGAVGLAVLSSIAAGTTASRGHDPTGVSAVAGYTHAFTVAAVIFLVAATIAGYLIGGRTRRTTAPTTAR